MQMLNKFGIVFLIASLSSTPVAPAMAQTALPSPAQPQVVPNQIQVSPQPQVLNFETPAAPVTQPQNQNLFNLSNMANLFTNVSQCAGGDNFLQGLTCSAGGVLNALSGRQSTSGGFIGTQASARENYFNQQLGLGGELGNGLISGGSQLLATQVGPAQASRAALTQAMGTDVSQMILRALARIQHSGNEIGAMNYAMAQTQLMQTNRTLGQLLQAQSIGNQQMAQILQANNNQLHRGGSIPAGTFVPGSPPN
jgi:hypothetical protein